MNRRTLLSALLASATLIVSTGAVAAASYTEDVVAQLVNLGFSDITAETTLLGRVKIMAWRADGQREVIINPRTGEILRDTWTPNGIGAPRTVLNDVEDDDNSGSGPGGDGDNSGSGRDDDSDSSGSGSGRDDEVDNSGSGSGDDRNDRDAERDKNRRD